MLAAWQGTHRALGRRLGLPTLTGCVLGAPDVAVSQEGALAGRVEPECGERRPLPECRAGRGG